MQTYFCCRFDVRQLIMSNNGFVVCVGQVVADRHGRSDGRIRRTYIVSPSQQVVLQCIIEECECNGLYACFSLASSETFRYKWHHARLVMNIWHTTEDFPYVYCAIHYVIWKHKHRTQGHLSLAALSLAATTNFGLGRCYHIPLGVLRI